MGGFGSGRWGYGGKGDARTLVEDCRNLDVNRFVREGIIRPGSRSMGTWEWSRHGERVASIGYEADARADAGNLRLFYSSGRAGKRETLDYHVPLVTTVLPSGGRRWWFLCVASRNGGAACGRRVAKLYLAPSSKIFACRHCHRLAYTSSRESRKYDSLFKSLAASSCLPLGVVKDAMKGDRSRREDARLRKAEYDLFRAAQKIVGPLQEDGV